MTSKRGQIELSLAAEIGCEATPECMGYPDAADPEEDPDDDAYYLLREDDYVCYLIRDDDYDDREYDEYDD